MTNKRLLMAMVIASAAAGISARAVDITASAPGFTDSGAFAAGLTQEDNTVQAGAVNDQTWDLEAFTASAGGKLGIVAGFDMKSGVASGPHTSGLGDIFIKVNGPLSAQNLTASGYNFVVHFTTLATVGYNSYGVVVAGTTTGTGIGNVGYEIYAATGTTVDYTGSGHINPPGALYSDVALYAKNLGAVLKTGTADYTNDVSDADSGGYHGGNHDLITGIDLTGLGLETANSISFFTAIGCGNDVLYGDVVPGPTTFNFPTPDGGMTAGMLGAGLIALGVMRRRIA